MIRQVSATVRAKVKGLDVQCGQTVEPAKFTKTQEWLGLAIFCILFMMWGLAYGLLDIMNYKVKIALGVSRAEATGLALSYYLAYWSVPVLGGPCVKYLGYRASASFGLIFLAGGNEVMSIGAGKLSLGVMCAGYLVVGLGVSMLERCANAYAVEAGPRSRAPVRILIAQSFAALGTVVAPPVAKFAIFDEVSSTMPEPDPKDPGQCLMPPPPSKDRLGDLSKVVVFFKWLGLGVFGLAFCLALVFFRTRAVAEPHVPESPATEYPKWQFWRHPLISRKQSRLWLGFAANFLNLGCQVTVAQFFIEHLRVAACQIDSDAANMMMVAQILFLLGRLVAAGLIELPAIPCFSRTGRLHRLFKPRVVLSAAVCLAAVFTGLGMTVSGKAAIACACMVMFCEAPTFPMIFEAASAGLGDWTPSAESIIILSISGGGIIPPMNGLLADRFGVARSWALAATAFSCVFSYSLLLNLVPSYREALDAAHDEAHKKASEDVALEERMDAPAS